MRAWRRATIASVVLTIIMFIVMMSVTVATVHDTIVVKRAVRTAVGATPDRPATLSLPLPPLPARGHELQPEFARFAADLIVRMGSTPTPPPSLNAMGTFSSASGKNNGWMLRSEDQLWLVFRGTSTRDEWERDFEMQQAPFLSRLVAKNIRKMTYPKMSQSPQIPHTTLPDARVHSGFLAIYLDIRELILDAISSSANRRVCVVGHSLGGALAQFAAYDIATHNPDKTVDTLVFGCPRVGNHAFAAASSQPANINSFVMLTNTCDLVPNLPLAVQPALKIEEPMMYVHPAGSHNFTDNRHTWIANHLMGVYIDYIEALEP